ncbi:hypothetical protein CYMTET_45640, partial [Cymbomonas tetramitiformis]
SGTIVLSGGWGMYNSTILHQFLNVVDVVIINHGLHYSSTHKDRADFREHMLNMTNTIGHWLQTSQHRTLPLSKVALVMETPAQHFIGTGHYNKTLHGPSYEFNEVEETGCLCVPLDTQRKTWREQQNEIMHNLISKFHTNFGDGARALQLVRNYELSAPRHDMHIGKFCGWRTGNVFDGCCDCTHNCYTPLLYDHILTVIGVSLDNGLGAAMQESNVSTNQGMTWTLTEAEAKAIASGCNYPWQYKKNIYTAADLEQDETKADEITEDEHTRMKQNKDLKTKNSPRNNEELET